MTTEFYNDTEIFITGGSGTMGKAAIEKLLRSCNVRKIYILLRSKRNVSCEERLSEIKKSKIFRVLKEKKPSELDDKLKAIPGDVTQDCLGVSEMDKMLMSNVSIFIHLAASTNFNLSLRTAIEANVKSTHEAIRLAECFEGLKIFLYVSTFFSNPHIHNLEDKIYPPVFDYKMAMQLLEPEYDKMDHILSAVQNKIITGFPNTYVFSKHLAEQLVNDYRHKLPVAIYRPSIVTGCYQEPEVGFTDTITGVMGLISIWGTGLLQVIHCKPDMVINLVALDFATNYMLLFVEKVSTFKQEMISEKIPIATLSSSNYLKHTFKQLAKCVTISANKYPLEKSLWISNITLTSCPFIFWIYTYFLQLLPAVMFDGLLMLFRQKPFMMKIQRKICCTMDALKFFITNEYTKEQITHVEEFYVKSKGTEFDINAFKTVVAGDKAVQLAMESQLKGCRKFIFNEDDSSLPRCRNILKIKMFLYDIIRVCVLFFVGNIVYKKLMN